MSFFFFFCWSFCYVSLMPSGPVFFVIHLSLEFKFCNRNGVILVDVLLTVVLIFLFPDDWWYWAYFHVPPSHSCIFFSEKEAFLVGLLTLSWKSSLEILDVSTLSDTWFVDIVFGFSEVKLWILVKYKMNMCWRFYLIHLLMRYPARC